MGIVKINKGHYWLFNDVKYYIKHPMHDFRGHLILLGNTIINGAQLLTPQDRELFMENNDTKVYFINPEQYHYDI